MTNTDHDQLILEHYRMQAQAHQLASTSTMADETTREAESTAIITCLAHAAERAGRFPALLEVGCGNGYLLTTVAERFPTFHLTGVDYCPEMVSLAASRQIPGCELRLGDARDLDFERASFDMIVSERCLINLLDSEQQAKALGELCRVLKPAGYLVLVEAFTDGFANLNKARRELGLPPHYPPSHTTPLDKAKVLSAVSGGVREVVAEGDLCLPPQNFLSSHYFIHRALYPAVTKREVMYNSEFVKFFHFLPPQGNFAPIQLFFLKRTVDGNGDQLPDS